MTAPIRSGKHLSPEERAEKIYESSMDEGYLAVDLKEFRDIIATPIREAEEAVALNVRVDTVLEARRRWRSRSDPIDRDRKRPRVYRRETNRLKAYAAKIGRIDAHTYGPKHALPNAEDGW